MKNKQYLVAVSKFYPIILCLVLITLHILSAYPGGMSPDTMGQYHESITHNYSSHHPPLMAMLWSLFHYVCQAPWTMLIFHLSLFWGGVLLLYYSDTENKYRFLYFILPFFPNILSQSGTIWKDVGFSFGGFFIIATCIFYTYRQKVAPLWLVIWLLLLCFYIVNIKFQAKFIVPILIYFILTIYVKKSIALRLAICTILSSIIIFSNIVFNNYLTFNNHSEQFRQLFDLSGISVQINNDNILPDYVKSSPLYSFEKLKKYYTPKWVDLLIFPDDRIYVSVSEPNKIQDMESAFFKAIIDHPVEYTKHRGINFVHLLFSEFDSKSYAWIWPEKAKEFGITLDRFFLHRIVIKYLKLFPKIFSINFISLILMIVYFNHSINNYEENKIETIILRYVSSIGILFSLVLFFATMASDYRYYYIVRILSILSLPIFLKSIYYINETVCTVNENLKEN